MGNEASIPASSVRAINDEQADIDQASPQVESHDVTAVTKQKTEENSKEIVQEPNLITETERNEFYGDNLKIIMSREVFSLRNEMSQIRRYFHIHPELPNQEINTIKQILKYLLKIPNIKIEKNVDGRGSIMVTLKGQFDDGPCILLHCNISGMPILESKNKENRNYFSKNKGIMHACGHDAHMSIMLITIKIISQYRDFIHGKIKFLFETGDESYSNKKSLIETLNNKNNSNNNNKHEIDQIYSLHLWNSLSIGKCIVKEGILMAGCLHFKIKMTGKGGHGAVPKGTNDCIVAISHLIQQIHTKIISRNVNATDNGVITIGKVVAGEKENIIAENAEMDGTIRWYNNDIFQILINELVLICKGIEQSFDVKCLFITDIENEICNCVINNSSICINNVKNAIKQVLPSDDALIEYNKDDKITMASSHFGSYLDHCQGCMFLVGCKPECNNNDSHVLTHDTTKFEIDERCLTIGAQLLCALVLDLVIPNTDGE